jgi:hypothetical protein
MLFNPYFRGYSPYYVPFNGYGFGFGGYNSNINAFGSIIGSQSLINTGTFSGNQTYSPTNIW